MTRWLDRLTDWCEKWHDRIVIWPGAGGRTMLLGFLGAMLLAFMLHAGVAHANPASWCSPDPDWPELCTTWGICVPCAWLDE